MKIDKERIIKKLKDNNISISNIDLDEVIIIYDNLINLMHDLFYKYCSKTKSYYLNYCSKTKSYYLKNFEDFQSDDRFDFTNGNNSETYFTIFKCLIDFYKKDLIKYLDHVLIDNDISFHNLFGNIIDNLEYVLKLYDRYQDDFMYGIYMDDPDYVEMFVYRISDANIDSQIISENYKKILYKLRHLYEEIEDFSYNKLYYHEDIFATCDQLDSYVSVSYFYMLGNSILINDCERAYNFLNYIEKNLSETLDKMLALGIKVEDFYSKDINIVKALFNYIDYVYKNFDKEEKDRITK